MEGHIGNPRFWEELGPAILTVGILMGLGGAKVLKKLFGGSSDNGKSRPDCVDKDYVHGRFLSKEEAKRNWEAHDKLCNAQLGPLKASVSRVETKLDKLLDHYNIQKGGT